MNRPVLIAGAGPVGLTVAHELARRGVAVRVIDRAAGPATTSRALATHARTLELFDQMGLAEELIARGRRVEHFTLHGRGRRLVRFDTNYDTLPTRFPFTLMIDQAVTEGVLRSRLADLGVTVQWGARLADLDADADGVAVTIEHDGAPPEHTRADWLVGADGGHSAVRRLLGLRLTGDATETWLIADAQVDVDLPADSIHWLDTNGGTVMLVPFPDEGKWRLLDTVDAVDDGPDRVAARFAEKIHRATGLHCRVEPPTWSSVFTIQQRMVERMRAGRCLLAGDAAHVHSPASGQGLNTGLQDAVNLAWKLAAVLREGADPELLDSYDAERMPVGRALLGSTRKATALVALKGAAMAVLLPVGTAVLRTVAPLRRRVEASIMGSMSGLRLAYTDGAPARAGEAAGTRLGWTGTDAADPRRLAELTRRPGWTLWVHPDATRSTTATDESVARLTAGLPPSTTVVVLGGDGPSGCPDPGGTLARRWDLHPGRWLLVRPDGYRGATGATDDVVGTGGSTPGPAAALAALGYPGDREPDPTADATVRPRHQVTG